MHFWEKTKNNIASDINKALGKTIVQASDFIYPEPGRGDLSLPCFRPAAKLNQSPAVTAQAVISRLGREDSYEASQAGPYLNFNINGPWAAREALKEIERGGDKYGHNRAGRRKRVVIEFSNANTHKEYHVGHLRNVCYGDAVSRILAANGYDSIPVSYINDFGIHAAKTIWALNEFHKNEIPSGDRGFFLGQVYAEAAQAMEKNPIAKSMAAFIMKKIESRRGEEYRLWRETRRWSIESFSRIYRELGVKFDHVFYESEFIDEGKKTVARLLDQGILKESEGAVIADLTPAGLGVLVFLRSDKTALYPVADLPLALAKFRRYRPAKSIYVVDARQSQYFRQLFRLIEELGHRQELVHLAYEFVKLPEGAMSSRYGRVVTYEDLRGRLSAKAADETKARHPEWSAAKTDKVVRALVTNTMKFEMVKVGADQAITFDIGRALKFEGFTAAYLLYTGARISSILRKKPAPAASGDLAAAASGPAADKERGLALRAAKFPEIVAAAATGYDPSLVAKYLFELAREANDFYHAVPVLKAPPAVRALRIRLITAVKLVMDNGLRLLGIEPLNEM